MVRKLCKEDVIQIRESTLNCKVRAGKDFGMYRLAVVARKARAKR